MTMSSHMTTREVVPLGWGAGLGGVKGRRWGGNKGASVLCGDS